MSIKLMTLAWEKADVSGNDLLAFLALCDWADDDGENCFPKIETIAWKTRIARRTMFDVIRRLQELNYIEKVAGKDERSNAYVINVSLLQSLPSKYKERKKKDAEIAPVVGIGADRDMKQVQVTTPIGADRDIAIRKNHQEPSIEPFSLSAPSSQDDVPKNGTGKKKAKSNGSDPRHQPFKDLIFRCYRYQNDDEDPPWGPADAKQLSSLLKETPKLEQSEFAYWLKYYSQSENINPADRPAKFLPKIHSYANGPLNGFGRPLEKKRTVST